MLNFAKLLQVLIGIFFALLVVTWIVGCIDMFDISKIPLFETKEFYTYLKWGMLVIFLLILGVMSPICDGMLSLFFPVRKISFREEQKINQAIVQVTDSYFGMYGIRPKLRVKVQDIPYPEAMAFGKRTIVLSTGLLKACTDEELTAVMAHEMGHLHHKDGVMSLLFILPWGIILGFFWLVVLSYRDQQMGVTIGAQMPPGDILMAVIIIFLMFYFPQYFFFLILVAMPILLTLNAAKMWFDWPTEYRADRFASSLGFSAGLIAFFERIEGEDIRSGTGFLSYFKYSHPPVALRISKIEKNLSKK